MMQRWNAARTSDPSSSSDRLTIRRHIFPQTYSQTSPTSSGKRYFGAGWALWACAPCRLRWLSRLNRLSSHTERISLIDPLISLLTSSLLTTANPGWHPTIWTSNRGPNGVKNKIKEEKQKTTHTHTYTHFTLISDAHISRRYSLPCRRGEARFDRDGSCSGLWPHQLRLKTFTSYSAFHK